MQKQKRYLSIDEQIELLSSKGLRIPSPKSAKQYLTNIGYYKLINGYKKPFIVKQNGITRFIDEASINDLYHLYFFDKNLRELLLRNLNSIEISIKSKMIDYITKNFGVTENDYLNPCFYKSNSKKPFIDIQSGILNTIQKQKGKQSSIRHYAKNYGYYPFWCVANVLTFGELCHLYSVMKQPDQYEISKNFKVKAEWLESAMIIMQLFRNACAHNEIIYCFKTFAFHLNQSEWSDLYSTFNIKINPTTGKYESGTNDLLCIFFIFKLILDQGDFNTFISQYKSIQENLKKKVTPQVYKRIESIIGIPNSFDKLTTMTRVLNNKK